MSITPLPDPPQRSQAPDVFVENADAFMIALPTFATELNALGTAYNLATTSTSVTSLTVGTGNKSLTVGMGLGFQLGMSVKIANTATPTNWMFGDVTSYDSGTGAMVVAVTSTLGSGTFSAWTISLAASGVGASLSTNTFTGVQNFALGANIASAGTINLTTATGNTVHVTGTTTITVVTLGAGMTRNVIFDGVLTLTHHATNNNLPGAANITTAAGDRAVYVSDGTTVYCSEYVKADGTAVIVRETSKIQPITASVGSSALTITLNPTSLDFRSTTLGSGTVTTVNIPAAISLVISSGSTLGTTSAVQSRIAVLAINNTGTVELAAVNVKGGFDFSSALVSTTAEGGAGGADSASTVYSTAARSSVAFRVVGYIESTQATAGTWATAPSTIDGFADFAPDDKFKSAAALVSFNYTGVMAASYNVSSVTDTSAALKAINFATPMSSASYIAVITQRQTSGTSFNSNMTLVDTSTASVANMWNEGETAGTTGWCVAIFDPEA